MLDRDSSVTFRWWVPVKRNKCDMFTDFVRSTEV
jgi:hypothetical protein